MISIEASVAFWTLGNCATATFVGRSGASRIVTAQQITRNLGFEQDVGQTFRDDA
jgi:hypothetical protein